MALGRKRIGHAALLGLALVRAGPGWRGAPARVRGGLAAACTREAGSPAPEAALVAILPFHPALRSPQTTAARSEGAPGSELSWDPREPTALQQAASTHGSRVELPGQLPRSYGSGQPPGLQATPAMLPSSAPRQHPHDAAAQAQGPSGDSCLNTCSHCPVLLSLAERITSAAVAGPTGTLQHPREPVPHWCRPPGQGAGIWCSWRGRRALPRAPACFPTGTLQHNTSRDTRRQTGDPVPSPCPAELASGPSGASSTAGRGRACTWQALSNGYGRAGWTDARCDPCRHRGGGCRWRGEGRQHKPRLCAVAEEEAEMTVAAAGGWCLDSCRGKCSSATGPRGGQARPRPWRREGGSTGPGQAGHGQQKCMTLAAKAGPAEGPSCPWPSGARGWKGPQTSKGNSSVLLAGLRPALA